MAAAKVEIYTKMFCGYCHRAKRLLDSKGVDYDEYDITMGGAKRDEMLARAPGARTVPQIFIDDAADRRQRRPRRARPARASSTPAGALSATRECRIGSCK